MNPFISPAVARIPSRREIEIKEILCLKGSSEIGCEQEMIHHGGGNNLFINSKKHRIGERQLVPQWLLLIPWGPGLDHQRSQRLTHQDHTTFNHSISLQFDAANLPVLFDEATQLDIPQKLSPILFNPRDKNLRKVHPAFAHLHDLMMSHVQK